MLLVQLLSLLPTGARRHVVGRRSDDDPGEAGSQGHLALQGPRAHSAQEAVAAAGAAEAGTRGEAVAAEAAQTCPASQP